MKLHENRTEFEELITLTAREKHIPESAVERDTISSRRLCFSHRAKMRSTAFSKVGRL